MSEISIYRALFSNYENAPVTKAFFSTLNNMDSYITPSVPEFSFSTPQESDLKTENNHLKKENEKLEQEIRFIKTFLHHQLNIPEGTSQEMMRHLKNQQTHHTPVGHTHAKRKLRRVKKIIEQKERANLCPICLSHAKNAMLLPSRQTVCNSCATELVNKGMRDPFTRSRIENVVYDALKFQESPVRTNLFSTPR
ncbi:hypothetical protein PCE1_000565 [Barthelona sp. PCE]